MNFDHKTRLWLIEINNWNLSISKQAKLLDISRSSIYSKSVINVKDLEIIKEIDKIHTKFPFYGKRRISKELNNRWYSIWKKHTKTLMDLTSIWCIIPKKRTTIYNKEHKTYPYLLKWIKITKVNQVWSTDITFIPTIIGWCYLIAIIDWYSRYVLSWKVSNSLKEEFCIQALQEALQKWIPEIFNSDQWSQFTSNNFTGILKQKQIKISMDSRWRCFDNIISERLWKTLKYEEVYLKEYQDIYDAYDNISNFFNLYNNDRLHQNLNYKTPYSVFIK